MKGAQHVRNIFEEYSEEVDAALRELFTHLPQYDMYKHMAYFMGFADEELKPQETYGGKRFRSSLLLMLADHYGVKQRALHAALSVELFHNFTLIHDDIVDGDTLRRGRPTVWKLFGRDHAINSGDGQALLAYQVLNRTPAERSADTQQESAAFVMGQYQRVIEGQYLDFTLTDASLGDPGVTVEAYHEMIGRKTADLIAAATGAVGIIAQCSEAERQQLIAYGHTLGIAYQLCDDLVSIWGSEAETGKRKYGDILERKKTLPVLYAYERSSEAEKKHLADLYNERDTEMSAEMAETVIDLLEAAGAYEHVRARVEEKAAETKATARALSLKADERAELEQVVDMLLPDVKDPS